MNGNFPKSEQNHAKYHVFTQNFKPRKLLEERKLEKKTFLFRIPRWTSFLMIPLKFLYNEYINRPKLSEQRKPIRVYSSFPQK